VPAHHSGKALGKDVSDAVRRTAIESSNHKA